jgi:hypothetical protein
MKVLFFFKSGDLLLLKSGEIKFANYTLRIKPSMHGTLQTAPLSRGCLARFPVDC